MDWGLGDAHPPRAAALSYSNDVILGFEYNGCLAGDTLLFSSSSIYDFELPSWTNAILAHGRFYDAFESLYFLDDSILSGLFDLPSFDEHKYRWRTLYLNWYWL